MPSSPGFYLHTIGCYLPLTTGQQAWTTVQTQHLCSVWVESSSCLSFSLYLWSRTELAATTVATAFHRITCLPFPYLHPPQYYSAGYDVYAFTLLQNVTHYTLPHRWRGRWAGLVSWLVGLAWDGLAGTLSRYLFFSPRLPHLLPACHRPVPSSFAIAHRVGSSPTARSLLNRAPLYGSSLTWCGRTLRGDGTAAGAAALLTYTYLHHKHCHSPSSYVQHTQKFLYLFYCLAALYLPLPFTGWRMLIHCWTTPHLCLLPATTTCRYTASLRIPPASPPAF